MKKRNNQGFTLIEVIVVAAIIAILAGILVPMIMNQVDEAKRTRAQGEADTYSKAIQTFRAHKTNGTFWPNRLSGLPAPADITLLFTRNPSDPNTPPTLPELAALGFDTTNMDAFDDVLTKDNGSYNGADGKNKWNQTMTETPRDPWGNPFICNAKDLEDRAQTVWVLSAGPNGTFETPKTATEPAGDDIGVKIVH